MIFIARLAETRIEAGILSNRHRQLGNLVSICVHLYKRTRQEYTVYYA